MFDLLPPTLEFTRQEVAVRPDIYVIPQCHRTLLDDESNQVVILSSGRGGLKTTSVICQMIEMSYLSAYSNTVMLMTREIMRTIKEGLYATVIDLMRQADVLKDFHITGNTIVNKKTQCKFVFLGLGGGQSTGSTTFLSNLNKLKGIGQKISIIFFEEASDVTTPSLDVILPTAERANTVLLVNPNPLEEEIDISTTRFFCALNPAKKRDPIIVKLQPYIDAGKGVHLHKNCFDIWEEEPKFLDKQLQNQAELTRGQYGWGTVWLGEPAQIYSGMPFSTHGVLDNVDVNDLVIHSAHIDPAHGGDNTAICFIGGNKATGKGIAFGCKWKIAFNMEPCLSEMADMIKLYNPNKTSIESNGLGTTGVDKMSQVGIKCKPVFTTVNKEIKIASSAVSSVGEIDFAKNLCKNGWLDETLDYTVESKEHDDSPDSFASALYEAGLIRQYIKY